MSSARMKITLGLWTALSGASAARQCTPIKEQRKKLPNDVMQNFVRYALRFMVCQYSKASPVPGLAAFSAAGVVLILSAASISIAFGSVLQTTQPALTLASLENSHLPNGRRVNDK